MTKRWGTHEKVPKDTTGAEEQAWHAGRHIHVLPSWSYHGLLGREEQSLTFSTEVSSWCKKDNLKGIIMIAQPGVSVWGGMGWSQTQDT